MSCIFNDWLVPSVLSVCVPSSPLSVRGCAILNEVKKKLEKKKHNETKAKWNKTVLSANEYNIVIYLSVSTARPPIVQSNCQNVKSMLMPHANATDLWLKLREMCVRVLKDIICIHWAMSSDWELNIFVHFWTLLRILSHTYDRRACRCLSDSKVDQKENLINPVITLLRFFAIVFVRSFDRSCQWNRISV